MNYKLCLIAGFVVGFATHDYMKKWIVRYKMRKTVFDSE